MSARTVCRYYTRGICRFGNMCRFLHPDEGPNDNSVSNGNKILTTTATTTTTPADNDQQNWAMAPAFVPKSSKSSSSSSNIDEKTKNKSYAEIAGGGGGGGNAASSSGTNSSICPYELGCPYGIYCTYQQHGELCELCDRYCLHPTDKDQRRKHNKECIQQHEKDMELSFAIARSQNKTCGICFDTIVEKAGREKRFGILPNCNHIFCLECIRKWRQAKQFENKITRSCPECRISSDFVCPSAFWVDTKDEKDKLILEYKSALGIKDCKYFNKGEGKCPFGNKCFYKHALPNGVTVDVGVPQKHRKIFPDVGLMELISDMSLFEFIDNRDLPLSWLEFISNLQESDDSDWSEDYD